MQGIEGDQRIHYQMQQEVDLLDLNIASNIILHKAQWRDNILITAIK